MLYGGGKSYYPYQTSKDDNKYPNNNIISSQAYNIFDNVTFKDNVTQSVYTLCNNITLFKNCTFIRSDTTNRQGINCAQGAIVLQYNNTFTNMTTDRL